MLNLQEEFVLRASLFEPLEIGETPIGGRVYYGIKSGEIIGQGLQARILGGGEWALICPDGYIRVDVRMQAETDDGARLYIQYNGLLELNDKVQNGLATGQSTEFTDQHFYTNPRVETGDPRYSWMNTTFFVAEGRITEGLGVEYRVYSPAG